MLTKEQKKEIVKKLREKFRENRLAVFCNFEGISFKRQQELKNQFKENNSEIFVVKKNLLRRALMEEGIEVSFFGSVILGVGKDEVLPAKLIDKFKLEKKEKLNFIGGLINDDGKFIYLSKEEVEDIAKLPSREELISRLVGTIKAPISNLNFVLKANLQKLVYIFSQISSES